MRSTEQRDLAVELAELDAKVNALLPPRYQHCYNTVSPTSMGSASLKYGADGKVAWDEIWTTFCDLALAGGPPHRGKLLEPVSEAEVAADPDRYQEVVSELHRAVRLTTGLSLSKGYAPGWVGLSCSSLGEAAWLQFAVNAENVSARRRGAVLQLPAGPAFRDEKEIKNVLVALSKSVHYWDGHLTSTQQTLAGKCAWEVTSPSEAAANPAEYEAAMSEVENTLRAARIPVMPRHYTGWVGVDASTEEDAGWLLRAVLVEQIMARREENILFLPVSVTAPLDQATRVGQTLCRAWELWKATSRRRPTWRPSGRT